MPCAPIDITLPDGPSGPAIPGFGNPFAIKIPNLVPNIDFPEDLLGLLDKLQFLVPSGSIKAPQSLNFGKDIFDTIMKLLDQFFPFLMFYKFFLPILNIIVCIIEVLCALNNPFKLVKAIKRLFRVCIPEFLSLFPIFALIVMLISLLLLILALIEYIVAKVIALLETILKNILQLSKALSDAADTSILAIAKKIGSVLCSFQNLFVLLSIFVLIFQVIKDILSVAFSLPPCDNSNADGCCSTDVCPSIVQSSYTRTTGTFQYLNKESKLTTVSGLTTPARSESFQFFDGYQSTQEAFINIVDAYDVTVSPKPIFFPTDSTYSATTSPMQAPYTVDLRFTYDPAQFGRAGNKRLIQMNDCIVVYQTSYTITNKDNTVTNTPTGTFTLAGGKGFENDGSLLYGFAIDGVTPISTQATLENLIHLPETILDPDFFFYTNPITFPNVEYIFKPNFQVLQNKNLVTLGCEPSLDLNKEFINGAFFGDAASKAVALSDLVKSDAFPDPGKTQDCLMAAVDMFRNNMTVSGAADFQATTTACLDSLKASTNDALTSVIGLGIDPCKSSFSLTPTQQFTTSSIKVAVQLNDRNALPLANNLPITVAQTLGSKLQGYPTFGIISDFQYDGYQLFVANLTSSSTGKGEMMVAFDNNILCTNTIPADLDVDPTRTLQTISYEFIYVPSVSESSGTSGTDTSGAPRHDESDLGRENGH